MAKKKQEEAPPAGSPAWMATFADLMNLLVCFFVLLYSLSTMDAAKLEEFIASMSGGDATVWDGSASALDMGTILDSGAAQTNQLAVFNDNFGQQTEAESVEPTDENVEDAENTLNAAGKSESDTIKEDVIDQLQQGALLDDVQVEATAEYVRMTLDGSILFNSGSAEIKSVAKPLLSKLAKILKTYHGYTITIEGHTDNVPIKGGTYRNNRQLSSERALSVLEYLIEKGKLNSKYMEHTGKGEDHPIVSNKTLEGKAKNRRVEIKLYNSQFSKQDR